MVGHRFLTTAETDALSLLFLSKALANPLAAAAGEASMQYNIRSSTVRSSIDRDIVNATLATRQTKIVYKVLW